MRLGDHGDPLHPAVPRAVEEVTEQPPADAAAHRVRLDEEALELPLGHAYDDKLGEADGADADHCDALLGEILIKARSLMVHRDPDTQREDLTQLRALIDDPRAPPNSAATSAAGCATPKPGSTSPPSTAMAVDVQRATLAYRLLTQPG